MDNIKDNIANLTTVAGSGSVVLGLNEILTLVLISTGIIFNVIRIYQYKKKRREEMDSKHKNSKENKKRRKEMDNKHKK